MKKLLKNLTALLLVITLALQFAVFATAQGKEATDDGTDIVYEIPEFRGEFEKHFQMADGTVVASTYAEPVNYYDTTDHTWKEIDNTLTKQNGRYKNKGHGGFNVSFRGDNVSGDLVEMSDGEYTLSWSVSVQDELGTKSTLKQQVNPSVKQRDNKEKDKFAADKAGSGMRYNSPFGGNKIIDVDYTVSQHKVKEDITIYSKRDANVVYYTYNCPSLTAVLTEDNSILFVNSENETVFTVHTPYMYDSEGNGSYEFDISLQQRGDTCTVVMVPDKEWLSSPDRAYPVVIDPTVTNKKLINYYDDTYIYQGDTVGANYNSNKMYIGLYNGKQNYALIKISTWPTLPTNATLLMTVLEFCMPTGSSYGGPFSLHGITSDWTEEDVCYSNRPLANSTIATNVVADFRADKLTFDITSYYNKVVSGVYVNRGFQVSSTSPTEYNTVYTSNCGDFALFPVVKIIYSPISESESNNTMATADEIELMPYPGTVTSITGTHTSSGTVVDNDYFKFTAPRHGRVEVSLMVTGGGLGMVYYLNVYNHSGSLIVSDNVAISSSESGVYSGGANISFTATKDGNLDGYLDNYYIRVYGTAGSTLPYRLTVKYTTQYASLGWRYPLPITWTDTSSVIGSRYDSDEGRYKYHKGLDFPANYGTHVYAVTQGYVHRSANDDSMGQYVTLYTAYINSDNTIGEKWETDIFDTSAPFVITYMHLSYRCVSRGDTVLKTARIGDVGSTGDSTGNHLHLGIYSHPTVPTQMTAYTPDDVISPYDFFYNSVTYSDIPY